MGPRRIRFSQLLLCAAAASGCASQNSEASDGTRGAEGRIDFTYQRSCFFGCPLEQPLLAGTREQVELSAAGDAEGVSVKASDAKVASFALERSCYCARSDSTSRLDIREDAACQGVWQKHCDNHVLVEALATGKTWLELRDAHGALIDRARVLVHDADDARFEATLPDRLGPDVGTRFDLASGKSLDLALTLYDADGLKLLAPEGVNWHVDDVKIATISGFLIGSGSDVHDGLGITVEATGPGDTEVHVQVPGLDTSVAVHVTR